MIRGRDVARRFRTQRLPMVLLAGALGLFGLGAALSLAPSARAAEAEPDVIATRLATMLQSARSVISRNQETINDPTIADKKLTADRVVAEAIVAYETKTGENPTSYDPQSRLGKLITAEIDAIRRVMDEVQPSINQEGVGFKGFIPATFARLVSEAFTQSVAGEATMRVTAPLPLVRNRKSRPDPWETAVIADRFADPAWTRGAPFFETATGAEGPTFRMAVPEYYAASCLSCHGGPKGSIDITGYPREGAAENDLAGVISITLFEPRN